MCRLSKLTSNLRKGYYTQSGFPQLISSTVYYFKSTCLSPQLIVEGQNFVQFCGFPWVETSTAGRVYDLCAYYMTGAPEGSPKVVLCGFVVFMEKPGIEPATPGLQGIALIHYTTGASIFLHIFQHYFNVKYLVFEYYIIKIKLNIYGNFFLSDL